MNTVYTVATRTDSVNSDFLKKSSCVENNVLREMVLTHGWWNMWMWTYRHGVLRSVLIDSPRSLITILRRLAEFWH